MNRHPPILRRIPVGIGMVLLFLALFMLPSSPANRASGSLDPAGTAGLAELSIADEEDVFNSVPNDPDPADHSPDTTLHMGGQVRKDGLVPPANARVLFTLVTLAGESNRSSVSEPGRQGEPDLPYFKAYPVCLIGDLPPPSA